MKDSRSKSTETKTSAFWSSADRVHKKKKNAPKIKTKANKACFFATFSTCSVTAVETCVECVCESTFQCVLISRDREDRCCFGSLQKCERTRAWNGRALACAGIAPSGQRQRREERRQSERLCELTGALGGDGRTDGLRQLRGWAGSARVCPVCEGSRRELQTVL